EAVDGAIDDMRAPNTVNKHVAIGWCSSDATDTNAASGAAYVFNDDGLPEQPTHRLCHNARHRVHGATGRKKNRPSDGPTGKILGYCDERHDGQSGSTRC